MLPTTLSAQDNLIVRKAYKEITLTGYTRGQSTVTVSSEVAGKVLKVHYDVGQISGDQPFAEIDPTFIKFQIDSTHQGVQNLKIALAKSRSRTAYLEKEFNRIDKLFRENSTAETQKDKAAEDLAQAMLEVESIEVQIAEMEITLKELQERKRRHKIYAPKGWIVTDKFIEPGEIISPNTALARVADYRELIIPLSVSGKELSAIQDLPSEFDAYLEGVPVKASINWVNPEFNEKTRKLQIELILRHYNKEKRGGLFFSLPLEIATEGLRIPKSAVITRYDNPRVRIKDTGEEIQVLILGESDSHYIIAENSKLVPGIQLAAIQP
jgi:RND family efflux transporter MFP subunit